MIDQKLTITMKPLDTRRFTSQVTTQAYTRRDAFFGKMSGVSEGYALRTTTT